MERFRQRYGIALTKKKLQEIILMLMAWEAVFAFSYLGYIELPAISTTTLHILVIVAAMMLGGTGECAGGMRFCCHVHVDRHLQPVPARPGIFSLCQRNAPWIHNAGICPRAVCGGSRLAL